MGRLPLLLARFDKINLNLAFQPTLYVAYYHFRAKSLLLSFKQIITAFKANEASLAQMKLVSIYLLWGSHAMLIGFECVNFRSCFSCHMLLQEGIFCIFNSCTSEKNIRQPSPPLLCAHMVCHRQALAVSGVSMQIHTQTHTHKMHSRNWFTTSLLPTTSWRQCFWFWVNLW